MKKIKIYTDQPGHKPGSAACQSDPLLIELVKMSDYEQSVVDTNIWKALAWGPPSGHRKCKKCVKGAKYAFKGSASLELTVKCGMTWTYMMPVMATVINLAHYSRNGHYWGSLLVNAQNKSIVSLQWFGGRAPGFSWPTLTYMWDVQRGFAEITLV